MLTPLEISIASAIISLAAFTVGSIALWKTHFARFTATALAGTLRQRIYPIKNEGENWYLASFDIPLSVTNGGACPGHIRGVRLTLRFPLLPIPNNREYIYAKWEIDPTHARRINRDRFQWLRELTISDWMPFTVLPKQTVTKHLIFETRWNDAVIQKQVQYTLELVSDARAGWQQVASWELPFTARDWGELANRGTSLSVSPLGSIEMESPCHPIDLHKYTGSKEPIPKEGFNAGPSFLDYPHDKHDT
jgi:hypothetical protein